MDPRLQQAAESGSIKELYALIDENPYILDNIDAVPFVNTPLHLAAASGNIQFFMEVLNLKPSFARKLNTSGYSPLHLAVENDQTEFVFRMLCLDHGLASAKGRNGITPFLSLVIRGNVDLVAECLLTSSKCIEDASVNGQNAMHLAVMNDRFEVLQVLTGWIQRMSQKRAWHLENGALNKVDFNSNTALHLAAYKNDHQAEKLLLECRQMRRNKVNGDGLTFLDILRNQGQNVGGGDSDLEQIIQKTRCKEAASMQKSKEWYDFLKSPLTFWTYFSVISSRQKAYSSDDRGVFLVVCTLIITATYQTALQPPGGVHQPGDANAGSVVMKQTFFILLWLLNTLGFCCAIYYTFVLIPLRSWFGRWLFWIGTSLCISYALAMAVISPHPLVFLSATFAFFLFFFLILSVYVFVHVWGSHRTVAAVPRLSWLWQN